MRRATLFLSFFFVRCVVRCCFCFSFVFVVVAGLLIEMKSLKFMRYNNNSTKILTSYEFWANWTHFLFALINIYAIQIIRILLLLLHSLGKNAGKEKSYK